jgi:G3E family GTPase
MSGPRFVRGHFFQSIRYSVTIPFLGPDSERFPTEADLFALPPNWMTAACMDGRFRRLSGWQGLASAASFPRAFTCRIKTRPGIFGFLPLSARPGALSTADFRLFYFPSHDDPLIERVSLPAAIAAASPEAVELIRDFPAHPEFAAYFAIAEIKLALTHPEHALGLALSAPTRRRISVPAGIAAPQGGWLVSPGGLEEDLPALDLARDLFSVLAAGLAATMAMIPDLLLAANAPAFLSNRRVDGSLVASDAPDATLRTEVLIWGAAARAAWPEASPLVDAAPYHLLRVAAGVEAPGVEEIAALKRPRLMVLSGFLGSGKTSFLNQFIEFHLARDQLVGVIQNEIGETGVDANLLEGEDSVLALDAGCVCCSLAGSLTRGIRQLTASLAPEIIVLETTGLANPMNMIDEFHEIADLAELGAVITVVDAARFRENLVASGVAAEQIRAADTVILNKCDLVSDTERIEIEAAIKSLNPLARVVAAVNGRVKPAVFGEGLSRHVEDQAKRVCDCGGHGHAHGVTHLDEGFSALRFVLAPSIDRDLLIRTLLASPPEVLRIKGIARFADIDERQVIQYVPGHADYEPVVRVATEAPFILIVGRDLDAAAMKRRWLPLLAKDIKP